MTEEGIYLASPLKENHIKFSYPNTKEGSKHYLMWSGGCDSTLLLYELIDAYGAENVYAYSYNYPWLTENKRNSEFYHRELFKSKMRLKGSKYSDFNHIQIDVTQKALNGRERYPSNQGFAQAIAWCFSLPMYVENDDYVYTGAIKVDQLTVKLEEYHKMLNGIEGTLMRNIHFREPYITFSKRDIIERLIKYDIYDSTWFCEMPSEDNIPCGKCVPCLTHKEGLIELSMGLNNSDDYTKAFVNKKIEDMKSLLAKNKDKCKDDIRIED